MYYVSFQKLKFEFYTDRFCKTVHESKDTKKWPRSQQKKDIQYANYFQKTIVSVLEVKVF